MLIRSEEYDEAGLSLVLPDSTRIDLTWGGIEKVTQEFWDNPERISSEARATIDFQRCFNCPLHGQNDICDALRPVLPFIKSVDKYVSFDPVTACYKEQGEKGILTVAETTMQDALRYISILSLTQYCKRGARYRRFFYGIMPFMKAVDAAVRLYLNMYYFHKGNLDAVNLNISEFQKDITMTASNQVNRLRYIVKEDVFLNAFVNTQIITEIFNLDIHKMIHEKFNVIR